MKPPTETCPTPRTVFLNDFLGAVLGAATAVSFSAATCDEEFLDNATGHRHSRGIRHSHHSGTATHAAPVQ